MKEMLGNLADGQIEFYEAASVDVFPSTLNYSAHTSGRLSMNPCENHGGLVWLGSAQIGQTKIQ